MTKTKRIVIIVFFVLIVLSCLLGCSDDNNGKYYVELISGELDYYGEIVLPKGDMSDHTFVGDELWVFYPSDDDHENYSPVHRYKVDLTNNEYEYLGKFMHNFGHCNTVDYCAVNDTLVFGNGGSENYDANDLIYIIENASALKEQERVDIADVAKIIDLDAAGFDVGQQVNVCWGESNIGSYNMIYALSNKNGVKYICRILLGSGENRLECGNMLDVADGEFNGTFCLMTEFTKGYSADYCNQGTDYYSGQIYEALGHDGIMISISSLLENNTISSKIYHARVYNELGAPYTTFSEGIALKDGYLFVGVFSYAKSNKIIIYKL